jgi:hypothetical protein
MELLFGSLVVGEIKNDVYSDQTWFGTIILSRSLRETDAGRRLMAYKRFSEKWNARLRANQDTPPDSCEWDAWADILKSPDWWLRKSQDGTLIHVNAPIFFKGGDFTCRPWEFFLESGW